MNDFEFGVSQLAAELIRVAVSDTAHEGAVDVRDIQRAAEALGATVDVDKIIEDATHAGS